MSPINCFGKTTSMFWRGVEKSYEQWIDFKSSAEDFLAIKKYMKAMKAGNKKQAALLLWKNMKN